MIAALRSWLVPRAEGPVGAALLRVSGLAGIGVFGNLMYVLVGRSVGEFVVVHGVLALLHGAFLLLARRTERAGPTEALGHAVMALNTVGIALAFSYEGSLSAGTIFFVVLHPAFAWLHFGRRGGLIWTAVAVGLVGVWWLGGIPLSFEPPELQKRDVLLDQGFAIVLAGAIAAFFRRTLDRRVAELQLARTRALRAAESRDRFLANVTHELRTPLVGALGTARLLIKEGQEDTVQEDLVAIERRGTQLQALLDELLDSAAARKGAAPVQTVVDVTTVLGELVGGWAGVVLDVPELPPVVLDGRSLREVLARLLTHAQRDAGSVNVRVHRSGDQLTLDLTASTAWGEGDALSLTRQRVERLGGSLTVGLDDGHRARFALPATFVSSPGLSVLIVEDNATNAAVTLGMLRHLGHTGHVVGDGSSALKVLGERAFDIVLLDLRLPDMSGYEVFKRMESGPRVVALTASTDERQNVEDAGLHGFLAKPCRLEELRAALHQRGV